MGAKRTRTPKPKSKPAPPSRLQNLAAKPTQFGDDIDEDGMLADNSGVFRVTSALQQAQTGHDEDSGMRFASDSLVMAAQRDGFRDDGTTIDQAVEETAVLDAAAQAEKKQRLATLVARTRLKKRR